MEVKGGACRSNGKSKSSSTTISEEDLDLRRGPWTVEEDFKLINYISNHGEGRWNCLARCAGNFFSFSFLIKSPSSVEIILSWNEINNNNNNRRGKFDKLMIKFINLFVPCFYLHVFSWSEMGFSFFLNERERSLSCIIETAKFLLHFPFCRFSVFLFQKRLPIWSKI